MFSRLFVVLFLSMALPISTQSNPAKEVSKAKFVDKANTIIGPYKQLTFVGSKSGEGYFSADGKKMIFQSEREPKNPFYQMYIMDLISGKTSRVSTGEGKTTCGWIHPSLKKVMWSSTHHDKDVKKKTAEEYENRKKAVKAKYSWSFDDQFDIYESDLNGKNIKRLTKERGYDAEGSYSPDGKWIAFASNRRGYTDKLSEEDQKIFAQDSSYMMDIYIMKSDGTQVKQLTDVKGYDGGPFFSADGKKITWRRFSASGASAEIYTMNTDGSDQKQITHLGSMSWAPYFHPSGDYIIFGSSVLGYSNFELFIVDAEGKKDPVRVTFDEGFDGLAAFSPDGSQLTWTHRNEKGESQIYIADWNDLEARQLLGLGTPTLQKAGLNPEIRSADLQSIVSYLAGESLAGRGTGSEEEKIYTAQLAELFHKWGLKPEFKSFLNRFDFTAAIEVLKTSEAKLVQGSKTTNLELEKDFNVLSFSQEGSFNTAPVVFAGYGIKSPLSEKFKEYNSYADLDVKGKWALIFAGLPEDAAPEFRQHLSIYARLQHKVTVAKNEGALGVLVYDPYQSSVNKKLATQFEGNLGKTSIAVLKISKEVFNNITEGLKTNSNAFNQLKKGESVKINLEKMSYLSAKVELKQIKKSGINVIATLTPAKGPASHSVLIGAHGDHLGRGENGSSLATSTEQGQIHYGADDNASGVAAVLELAHFFAQPEVRKSLKHNITFAIWSGEELGLLGSQHFADQYKTEKKKSLNSTYLASINLDMVGRLKGKKLQVQGLASAQGWPEVLESTVLKTGLSLSTQNDPYLPTDALTFYTSQLPSISLFTGSHGEYHTPRDQAHLIDYPGLLRVTEFTAELVKDLSFYSNLLKYQKVESSQQQMPGRSFRIYLGTIPDYSQEGVRGVRISGVSKNSPAEKAGLQAKDVIIHLDGRNVENIYDYVYGLQAMVPQKETVIKVTRGGKEVEMKILPQLKE